MKLKFINLLLAAFLLIGSAQALTSCKDTDEDLYAQLRNENLTIKQNLEAQIEVLRGQITALEGTTAALQTQINNLKAELANYVTKAELANELDKYVKKAEFNNLVDQYIAAVSDYKNLKAVLDDLKKVYNEVQNAHGDFNNIGERFTAIEGRLATLEATLSKYDFDAMVTNITNIQNQLNNLEGQVTVDLTALKADVAALKAFKENWEGKLGTIEQNAADALANAAKNASDIAALADALEAMNSALADHKTDNDEKLAAITSTIEDVETKVETILEDYVTSGQMSEDIAAAIEPLATKEALATVAEELRKEAAENLAAVEERLQNQIVTVVNRLNGVDTKISEIDAAIAEIQGELVTINENIQKNANAISTLKTSLDNVIVRITNLENRITSIVLQGTVNPVIGYLATPLGIQSNILMNYAGENTTGIEVSMPNYFDDGVEYDGTLVITDADYALLQECGLKGATTFAPYEKLMNNGDGNLGTIYLTLNPANIDLVGKDFTVVNSQNKVMPIELKNLRPSTEALTMGYTRSEASGTSANGFYEADATVDPADIDVIKITVDKSLKDAAKKVLNERNANSLLALGNALYNQFNGILPALGIRAAWDEAGETTINQSVYSQYGIAATVFQPLSYKFLLGKSFRTLPVPDITKMEKFKVDYVGAVAHITFPTSSYEVNGKLVDLNLGIELTNLSVAKLTVNLPVYYVTPDGNVETGYYVDGTVDIDLNKELLTQLNQQLANEFYNLNEGANAMINEAFSVLINSINAQLGGLMGDMGTVVNSTIQQVAEALQNEYNGKIDKFINRVENQQLYDTMQSIVNRLNKVLSDPNHYLQATLLYHNGNGYGMFSNTLALPTIFKGGEAVLLTPTTYTGEIVTPAYKKFVAVTNVYKADDTTVNAQAGDATCKSLVKAANEQPYMNEVVAGERRTIPFVYKGGAGYIYEIVYQALDYSGYTSTQKFYVSIK